MEESRKYINQIAEELKGKMSAERRKNLESIHRKLEKWARMEEGDVDALVELCYERGLWSKEAFDEYRRNKNNPEYD